MTKPYDSSTKFLIEEFPRDWLTLAGLDVDGPVDLIDTNLSTVTAEADKVIRIARPTPWLAHFETQSSRDIRLVSRLFRYNALLDDRHDLPTRTVVVLLRPGADGPELTGEYRRQVPGGPDHLIFRYDVFRVWREPVASFLDGGLGTVPLAPVADLGEQTIEEVVELMDRRFKPAPPALNDLLWSSVWLLMGMRYPPELANQLLQGVWQMEESATYQAAVAQGEIRGEVRGEARGLILGESNALRRLLLREGTERFGLASVADRAFVQGITQLDRLDELYQQIRTTKDSSWAQFWTTTARDDLAK